MRANDLREAAMEAVISREEGRFALSRRQVLDLVTMILSNDFRKYSMAIGKLAIHLPARWSETDSAIQVDTGQFFMTLYSMLKVPYEFCADVLRYGSQSHQVCASLAQLDGAMEILSDLEDTVGMTYRGEI